MKTRTKSHEIWKDIPEYEGYYQVSNLGNVKSLERTISFGERERTINERILKHSKGESHYKTVLLSVYGKKKRMYVHILIAMAFLGYTTGNRKISVDHKDNDKFNNTLDNLQIITQRLNVSKDKKGYTSEYTGVSKSFKCNTWRSDIYIDGRHYYLGSYKSEYEAHNAYLDVLNYVQLSA